MKKCRKISSLCLAVLMLCSIAAMPVSAMSASIEMITEPIYGSIGKFSDGVAIVRDFETRLYGVIDENGNVVHAMKYERIDPFYRGVALAAYRDAAGNYAECYLDRNGGIAATGIRPNAGVEPEPQYTYWGASTPQLHRKIPGTPYLASEWLNPDLLIVYAEQNGVIDRTMTEVIPCMYDNLYRVNDNRLIGQIWKDDGSSDWFLLDKTGREITLPGVVVRQYPHYDGTNDFGENLVIVKSESGLYGICDLDGNVVVPLEYEYIGYGASGMLVNGYAFSCHVDGEYHYIDEYGTVVTVEHDDSNYPLQFDTPQKYINANGIGIAVYVDQYEPKYRKEKYFLISKDVKDGKFHMIPGTAFINFRNQDPEGEEIGINRVDENNMIIYNKNNYMKYGLMRLNLLVPGTPMGDVLYTDIVAYIDDKPICSYNIAGNTYIVVEDLAAYGFDVQWIAEGSGKLVVGTTRTAAPEGYTTTYVPEKNTNPAGSVAMQYLYTNITAWLGDKQVTGYNIGGYTCIGMDDLAAVFATNYVWDAAAGALRLYTQP